jgi:hypothetical protein
VYGIHGGIPIGYGIQPEKIQAIGADHGWWEFDWNPYSASLSALYEYCSGCKKSYCIRQNNEKWVCAPR